MYVRGGGRGGGATVGADGVKPVAVADAAVDQSTLIREYSGKLLEAAPAVLLEVHVHELHTRRTRAGERLWRVSSKGQLCADRQGQLRSTCPSRRGQRAGAGLVARDLIRDRVAALTWAQPRNLDSYERESSSIFPA